MMITYMQDTTPLLNDWSMISTASGVYKELIINVKKFWQMGVDLMYLSHLLLSLISKQNVLLNVHVSKFSRHILLYLLVIKLYIYDYEENALRSVKHAKISGTV